MNAKALIPVVTALIGFAVGWTSHHTQEPAPDASHNTPAPPSPKTRSANADAAAFREHHGYQKAAPGEEASATVPPVNQAPYIQTFVAAVAHRDKARADRLAEALGLDEAQRQRLNEIIEQHKTDDQGPAPRTPREIIDQKVRAAASIDGEINQILTPEQKGAYEAMKNRQVKNQIESRAQRELASLGDRIDMSPEQRDAALQALRANAAAKPPLDAGLLGTSSSNPNGGLFADMLADAAADNPDLDMLTDPFALHREMAQLQIRQIEEKVARMAAVLTPAQLAQYRASLEADASFLQSAAPPMPNK